MDIPSVELLCKYFISSAIQRCRKSDELCRLSVFFKSPTPSHPPIVPISISDTGIGSCLEEFKDLKYYKDPTSAETWDGVISVTTTGICDSEIYHYLLNVNKTVSTTWLTKLPSTPKNGAKFSGTEVSFSASENIDDLLGEIACFLRKILVLKIPVVTIELVVDIPGSQSENLILANECIPLRSPASTVAYLKSGFEDYVLKHRNRLNNICHACFSNRECVKVGSGVAYCKESHRSTGQVMEVVVIISELSEPTAACCVSACDTKTEVLYFKDFSPCSVSQSSLNALTNIDWKSYGLTLRSIVDQDGHALLEWENLPPYSCIDIALHFYHKQNQPAAQRTQLDRTLTRKAMKLALDDLKEKNKGVLLSTHALKIRSYAPDLAKTIAGLVLSSNDTDFQRECLSLLGLQLQEIDGNFVEECIKEQIVSVIDMNDKKPQRSRETAPFLFDDDCYQEQNFQDEDYEEGEEAFTSQDL